MGWCARKNIYCAKAGGTAWCSNCTNAEATIFIDQSPTTYAVDFVKHSELKDAIGIVEDTARMNDNTRKSEITLLRDSNEVVHTGILCWLGILTICFIGIMIKVMI